MAVRAPRIECTFLLGSCRTANRMGRVALWAEERLTHYEQVVVHRPVRGVAGTTVLVEVRMLVHKRTLLLRVALGAGRLHRFPSHVFLPAATVRIMAVGAEDLLLRYGVVVREGKCSLHLLVAPLAHLCGVPDLDLEVVSTMDPVAVGARHIGDIVSTRVPVMEVERGVGRMALQADKRFCLRGQVLDVNKGLVVAGRPLPSLGIGRELLRR